MKTYKNKEKAYEMMESKNRSYRRAGNSRQLMVMVEGPEEGEHTIMDIKEAIENSFTYEWA
ncbi:hypothetical protein [Desulforegula conservatrix]|uniref:hypothetical protein n=1 Tax=Desulforegula conservatrix TaxID=153026 RepID=UPI000403851F|nr:hypothetical protein [Desulforegula conservatrix]